MDNKMKLTYETIIYKPKLRDIFLFLGNFVVERHTLDLDSSAGSH